MLDGNVWTIGSEGLFRWTLNKNVGTFEPSFVKSKPATFVKAHIQKEKITYTENSFR